MQGKSNLALAVFGAALWGGASVVLATEIDTGFGSSGQAIGGNQASMSLYGVSVQRDNKILAVGSYYDSSRAKNRVLVERRLANGQVDASFGSEGVQLVDISSGNDFGWEVVQADDGGIWVAGDYNQAGGGATPITSSAYLLKLSANGGPDTNFGGGDGWIDLPFAADYHSISGMLVSRESVTLLVVSRVGSNSDSAVVRYNIDGTLDTSFGGGDGFLPLSFGLDDEGLSAIDELPDGRLILAGRRGEQMLLARVSADGQLDTTFGAGLGYRTYSWHPDIEWADELVVLPDGKIVVVGFTLQSVEKFWGRRGFIARFLSNGDLDSAFGSSGVTAINPTNQAIGTVTEVVRGGDGRLWVGGWLKAEGSDPTVLADDYRFLAQFTADGLWDSSFSDDGWFTFRLGDGAAVRLNALAMQGDGRLLLAGMERLASSSYQTVITRFIADESDRLPDAISFSIRDNLAPQTVVSSESITIAGLGNSVSVLAHVEDGLLSVNDGEFSEHRVWLRNGDRIQLQATASSAFDADKVAMLDVGGVEQSWQPSLALGQRQQASFTLRTEAADTTPDRFSFTAVDGVMPGDMVTSNIITVTGINSSSTISITGGQYSLGCTASFTNLTSTIENGQTVCVRHTPANFGTTVTTLTIGSVSANFQSTTVAADTTPEPFSFTSVNNAMPQQVQTSNTITVLGINTASPIAVSNGQYSIGCNGSFTSNAGTVENGQTVCVRHTPTSYSATTTTTLTIGGISATFSSTTGSAPATSDPGGGGGGGGSVGWFAMILLALISVRRRGVTR